MKIAFIGIGNMGAPMSANLAAAGHQVLGYDIADRSAAGVTMVGSYAEAVAGAEIVITMLPDAPDVTQVYQDTLPHARKGTLFIEGSTIDVATAREVAQQAASAGMSALDAPVSGGVMGAEAASLTIMVGGAKPDSDRAKPIFDLMGKRVIHCGDNGAGQATKVCNNMLAGINMAATCEAIALADKLGLDPQKLFEVVSTSSGFNWAMNVYCPIPGVGPDSPSDHGYEPGFSSDLMLKDLRLSQSAADMVAAETPMGARAEEIFAHFVEDEGQGSADFSALYPRYSSNWPKKS
ncbi:MAG: 3-hydroxyisobutyrate dehydrogenase [Pseudomonadota bacterium]